MSITQIDFGLAKELTAAVRSLFNPDKSLPDQSALTFMRLVQVTGEDSVLTAYLQGGAWFERTVKSQGIIDTTYLFDADDLLTVVNEKLDVWKLNGLRLSQTSANRMKVDCILPNSKRLKLTNNVLISTYNGDEADFENRMISNENEYTKLATITQEQILDFFHAINLCDAFSVLKSDTQDRGIGLRCEEGNLYISASERMGQQGLGFLCVLVGYIGGEDWVLNVQGRHLTRSTFISKVYSNEDQEQTIIIARSEKDQRVLFKGQQGKTNLPLIEEHNCKVLSKGVGVYFFGYQGGTEVSIGSHRVFDIQDLINAVQICTPKKNASRNDIVLEFEDEKAILYKRSDSKKSERAEVLPSSTEGMEQDWLPVVVDHSYLTDALKALKTYIARQQKLEGGFADEVFDYGDDSPAEEEDSGSKMFVVLTQASNARKVGHNFLYLQGQNRAGCRVMLQVQTKERTEDIDESD